MTAVPNSREQQSQRLGTGFPTGWEHHSRTVGNNPGKVPHGGQEVYAYRMPCYPMPLKSIKYRIFPYRQTGIRKQEQPPADRQVFSGAVCPTPGSSVNSLPILLFYPFLELLQCLFTAQHTSDKPVAEPYQNHTDERKEIL